MEYAVIYESRTGNTRRIAEAIFQSLHTDHKQLYNAEHLHEVPHADVYFMGFGVRNGSCPMKIINCLDAVPDGKIALFATCGFPVTDRYRAKIAGMMDIWLPEDAEYLGLYLCQGRIPDYQQEAWLESAQSGRDRMEEAFRMADSHPDHDDINAAAAFAARVQKQAEQ